MAQTGERAGVRAPDGAPGPPLKIVEDLEVIVSQHRLVTGEGEDDDRQGGEHQDVDRSIDGDRSQNVAIPEGSSAQRELELVTRWWMISYRVGRRWKREPGITPQASVPAEAPTLSSEKGIRFAELASVGAYKLMTVKSTPDQLITKLRAESLGVFRSGRGSVGLLHPCCLPSGASPHTRPRASAWLRGSRRFGSECSAVHLEEFFYLLHPISSSCDGEGQNAPGHGHAR